MKFVITLSTYNRCDYLGKTIESLNASDIPLDVDFLVIDDGSTENTEKEIEKLIFPRVHIKQEKNLGNEVTTKNLFQMAINRLGADVIVNIDADALFKQDWFKKMMDLFYQFRGEAIISGFNTTAHHHKILKRESSYVQKASVGGLGLMMKANYALPGGFNFVYAPIPNLTWDGRLSRYAEFWGIPIIVTTPSRIQHIGEIGVNSRPSFYDTAADF